MCLNVKTLTSRSKYFNVREVGLGLLYQYNCGQCAECLQAKQNEYVYRAAAECDYTYLMNGFVYWDTFTYSEANCPVYNSIFGLSRGYDETADFRCFDVRDYRLFFKRLRRDLEYHGYDVKDNLKYFFVSEYGGITHRPHYHCLFFVTIPGMTPEEFDKFLERAWQLGRRDMDHTVKQKVINGRGALNYVAKYVVKDCDYMEVIEKFRESYKISDEDYKNIKPFHRQSQGFGEYLITQQDYDFMFKENKMVYKDVSGPHIVDIPMYIKRKLWYKLVKDENGAIHWRKNEQGMLRDEQYVIPSQISTISERYQQTYDFLHSFCPDNYGLSFDIKLKIDEIMDGRSFYDLAVYTRLYKGRNFDHSDVPSIKEMLHLVSHYEDEMDYSMLSDLISKGYDMSVIVNYEDIWHRDLLGYKDLNGNYHDVDSFYAMCNVEDIEQFRGFDYVLNLMRIVMILRDRNIQSEFERRRKLKSRMKALKKSYN